jgi:SAM-dependent methyltransferase
MRIRSLHQIRHDAGQCWIAEVPAGSAAGDESGKPWKSTLRLFEDGKELGPWRSTHDDIRQLGLGRYSHWQDQLYFSTSDGSDPVSNGRTYQLVVALAQEDVGAEFRAGLSQGPVNFSLTDLGAEQAEAAAHYALRVVNHYLTGLPGGRPALKGRCILELGPGTDFATSLILRGLGADAVTVADRFLSAWRQGHHAPIYRHVIRLMGERFPDADIRPLLDCLDAGSHPEQVIRQLPLPVEEISAQACGQFDLVFSNAVLEHVRRPANAARALHELTVPGGMGFHQVDFRDHRDMSRPLEFLLPDEGSFQDMFEGSFGECGNRIRPHQWRYLLQEAGFAHSDFQPDMFAQTSYLDDFLPRLRAAGASPYQDLGLEQLRPISGYFVLRR